MTPLSPLYSPLALVQHVAEQLEMHAEALRMSEVGSPEAQARWLDSQVKNLREAETELKRSY